MGRGFGSKQSYKSEEARNKMVEAGKKLPRPRLTFRVRYQTAKQVAEILEGALPNYLQVLDTLARENEDPSVRLSASRYLVDRVLGKTTEKRVVTGEDGDPVKVAVSIRYEDRE